MVRTRAMKEKVLTNAPKSVATSEIDNTYECTVVIRIHKDALIKIDGHSQAIPLINNDLNIGLHVISEENDSKEESTVDDSPNDKDSSSSDNMQVYQPAPTTTLKTVNSAWLRCKNSHKNKKQKLSVKDVVLAKLRGHSAWPAIIIEMPSKNMAKVQFFGAQVHEKFGFVIINEITLFKDSIVVILMLLKKNLNFSENQLKKPKCYAALRRKIQSSII